MEHKQQRAEASQDWSERLNERRKSVLFVDPAQPMHQRIIQELGGLYEVRHALTAGEALESLRRRPPDMLITEIDLPDMSGFALCEQIRSQPASTGLPILLLTARDGIMDKINGFQSGADDYLVKPINPRFFSARVRLLFRIKALEQKRAPGD
ncbi:MAG TPA: response regulator [Ktedonobacterales bacterium]|nr:response regulator [Ktedonobacterales bacterium]